MDALISGFVEEYLHTNTDRLTDYAIGSNTGSFTNKLSKFTLATFDDEGKYIHYKSLLKIEDFYNSNIWNCFRSMYRTNGFLVFSISCF